MPKDYASGVSKSEPAKPEGGQRKARNPWDVRDHAGSASALRRNMRDLSGVRGMCQFSNFSPPLNYRGRNRKNLNHDANGKADSVASAAALHILKRDPAADRRLFIRRYRPSSALTLRYRRRRRCGLLIGCCEREGRERRASLESP